MADKYIQFKDGENNAFPVSKIIVVPQRLEISLGDVNAGAIIPYTEKETDVVVPQGYTLFGVKDQYVQNGGGFAMNIMRPVMNETTRKIKVVYQGRNTNTVAQNNVTLCVSAFCVKDEFMEILSE